MVDEQLSQSMIPHHAFAIKTCAHADIDEPETIELLDSIVQTQREVIVQEKDILELHGMYNAGRYFGAG